MRGRGRGRGRLGGWDSRLAGWPAGRMAGGRGQWSGVSSVAGWPGGWVAGWPGGRVAGWPGGRVVGWPGGRVAGWPGGWPGVCRPLAYQAACLFVHFGEFSHTHQC